MIVKGEKVEKKPKDRKITSATTISPEKDLNGILRRAREKFYQMGPLNVIGIGINEIREDGQGRANMGYVCMYNKNYRNLL